MKKEISVSNVWMCMVVIFIHVVSYSIPKMDIKNNFDIFLLSVWSLSLFVVPGFIFFSGLKSFLKEDFSYPKFLLKRLMTIVIPYMVWVGIYFLYFKFYSDYDDYKSMTAGRLFLGITFGNVTSHFYFVVAIVQFYLLMPLWRVIVKHIEPVIGIPLFFVIMILAKQYLLWFTANFHPDFFDYTDRIFLTYIAFWIAGCYAGRYYDSFSRIISKNCIAICIIFAVSASVMVVLNFEKYFLCRDLPFMENMYVLYQTAAILFLCFVSDRLKSAADWFLAEAVNAESYNIYLSHCLILLVTYNTTNFFTDNADFLLRFVLTYFISIAFWSLCYVIKYLLVNLKKNRKPKRKPKH